MAEQDSNFLRDRQKKFAAAIQRRGLAGALVTTSENVQYLAGYRPSRHRPGAVWIDAGGATHLALADGGIPPAAAVDHSHRYEAHRAGSLVDHQVSAAVAALAGVSAGAGAIGIDGLPPSGRDCINIMADLLLLRRTKDDLEVRLLKQSIAAVEAVFTHIRQVLSPDMTEIDVCAECHAAAVRACGEPIGWLGNDFQSNSGGGQPRNRKIASGDLMPLDLGLGANGYIADLCRTFCVGQSPAAGQRRAFDRIMEVFALVLPQLRPGANCAALHQQAIDRLNGFDGLSFGHHLGHGIGLNAHETPRVNKHWNDVLAPGDVITIEPGLYGAAIRGGIRLENNFLITQTGFEQLSHYPLDL